MFFPALLAKVLSAGALAQAATGATVVVLAFAGAGAAGVLPGPVQDTFTSLVSDEDEAPVEEAPVYEPPVEETPVAEAPVEEAPAAEPPVETAPVAEPAADDPAAVVAAWMAEPIDGSFGSWVRSARHNPQLLAAIEATGRNFGYYVSHRAQQQGVDLDDLDDDGTVGHDRDGDRGPGRGNGDHRGDGRGPGDDRDGHRGGDDHRGGDRGGNDNRGPDRGHGRD